MPENNSIAEIRRLSALFGNYFNLGRGLDAKAMADYLATNTITYYGQTLNLDEISFNDKKAIWNGLTIVQPEKLISGNILKGVTIMGVDGGIDKITKVAGHSYATSNDIIAGKYAYGFNSSNEQIEIEGAIASDNSLSNFLNGLYEQVNGTSIPNPLSRTLHITNNSSLDQIKPMFKSTANLIITSNEGKITVPAGIYLNTWEHQLFTYSSGYQFINDSELVPENYIALAPNVGDTKFDNYEGKMKQVTSDDFIIKQSPESATTAQLSYNGTNNSFYSHKPFTINLGAWKDLDNNRCFTSWTISADSLPNSTDTDITSGYIELAGPAYIPTKTKLPLQIDTNTIKPENIKSKIKILGIEGTFGEQQTWATPIILGSTIIWQDPAEEGIDYDFLDGTHSEGQYIKLAPSNWITNMDTGIYALIDSDVIKPDNIRAGQTILGVTGNENVINTSHWPSNLETFINEANQELYNSREWQPIITNLSTSGNTSSNLPIGRIAFLDGNLVFGTGKYLTDKKYQGENYNIILTDEKLSLTQGENNVEWYSNIGLDYIMSIPLQYYYSEQNIQINLNFSILQPELIKYNEHIGGITGTFSAEEDNPITARDILWNKVGFVNGQKYTGTIPINDVIGNIEPSGLIPTTLNAGYYPSVNEIQPIMVYKKDSPQSKTLLAYSSSIFDYNYVIADVMGTGYLLPVANNSVSINDDLHSIGMITNSNTQLDIVIKNNNIWNTITDLPCYWYVSNYTLFLRLGNKWFDKIQFEDEVFDNIVQGNTINYNAIDHPILMTSADMWFIKTDCYNNIPLKMKLPIKYTPHQFIIFSNAAPLYLNPLAAHFGTFGGGEYAHVTGHIGVRNLTDTIDTCSGLRFGLGLRIQGIKSGIYFTIYDGNDSLFPFPSKLCQFTHGSHTMGDRSSYAWVVEDPFTQKESTREWYLQSKWKEVTFTKFTTNIDSAEWHIGGLSIPFDDFSVKESKRYGVYVNGRKLNTENYIDITSNCKAKLSDDSTTINFISLSDDSIQIDIVVYNA